jgi:hypothetical protein
MITHRELGQDTETSLLPPGAPVRAPKEVIRPANGSSEILHACGAQAGSALGEAPRALWWNVRGSMHGRSVFLLG